MNQLFDLIRFLRLLRAHWAESWKTYAWFFGVCAILNGILLALVLQGAANRPYDSLRQSAQSFWYVFGLLVTGLVFATRYFESFSSPGSTLIQLMRPASSFEKWCLALLFVGILFPLAYTVVYVGMNYPAVAYAKAHYVVMPSSSTLDMTPPIFQIYLPFIPVHSDPGFGNSDASAFRTDLVLTLAFLTVLAICMGGRVFFRRAAVLKTWLLAFAVLLIGVCIDVLQKTWLFTDSPYWADQGRSTATLNSWDMALAWTILFGIPILLWIGLFFHIKEREVS